MVVGEMHLEPQHVVGRNYPVDNFQIMHMKNEDEGMKFPTFLFIFIMLFNGKPGHRFPERYWGN